MTSETELRILVHILVEQKNVLNRMLAQANAEIASAKEEMAKRDADGLTSYIGPRTKSSYKELVRVLNTCKCCPRHMSKRINPEDFDKEEMVRFQVSMRSEDEKRADIDKCGCPCRQEGRLYYREYYHICVLCDE